MGAEDVFADAVLDQVAPAEAGAGIAGVVATVTRTGRAGWFGGLDRLADAVTRRRAQVAATADLPALRSALATPVAEAVRLEYRTLFADPDDLARLEEAELLALPNDPIDAHRAVATRTWVSPLAEDSHRQAVRVVVAVHQEVVRQAVEQMANATALAPAVVAGLTRLAELVGTGVDQDAPLDEADWTALAVLAHPSGRSDASGPPPWLDTVAALADDLRWRGSAQDRLVAALPPVERRRLANAWSDLVGSCPTLADAVREWHRTSGPVETPDRGGAVSGMSGMSGTGGAWGAGEQRDVPGAYLFTTLLDPVAETADLDQLERSIAQDHAGAGLDDIDGAAVERIAGRAARSDLDRLRRAVRAVTGSARQGTDGALNAAVVRRRVSTMALRRGLGRATRIPPGSSVPVTLVVDRSGPPERWNAVRAAALAVGELVRRGHPDRRPVVLTVGSDGEIRAVGLTDLLYVSALPGDDRGDGGGSRAGGGGGGDPARVVMSLRRAGASLDPATILVIGDPVLGAGLARVGVRWDWTVLTVEVTDDPDPHACTTGTIRAALAAVRDLT